MGTPRSNIWTKVSEWFHFESCLVKRGIIYSRRGGCLQFGFVEASAQATLILRPARTFHRGRREMQLDTWSDLLFWLVLRFLRNCNHWIKDCWHHWLYFTSRESPSILAALYSVVVRSLHTRSTQGFEKKFSFSPEPRIYKWHSQPFKKHVLIASNAICLVCLFR